MSETQTAKRPGCFRRLIAGIFWLLFSGIFTVLLIAGLITLAIAAINRSWLPNFLPDLQQEAEKLSNIPITVQNLGNQNEAVRADLNGLLERDVEQQTQLLTVTNLDRTVDNSLNRFDTRLNNLENLVTEDLSQQNEMLSGLTDQVDGVVNSQGEAIGLLNNAVSILQNDINESNLRIDEVGGELDVLTSEIVDVQLVVDEQQARLDENIASLQATEPISGTVGQTMVVRTLSYLRILGLVSDARYQLSQGNSTGAEASVAVAQAMIDEIIVQDPTVEEVLAEVGLPLALASEAISDAPEEALTDLDLAWQALDGIVAESLNDLDGKSEAVGEDAGTDDESNNDTDTSTDEDETDADSAEDDTDSGEDSTDDGSTDSTDDDSADSGDGGEDTSTDSDDGDAVELPPVVGTATVVTSRGSNLNMREEPTPSAGIVKKLPHESVVNVLDVQFTDESGELWYQVESDGDVGWVVARFLEFAGDEG